ncbi:TPA: conjugal transfer protein TraD [Legionella pneumophila]|nr:conjugal transfer protein TraD [Legionella pneumophila]HAU1457980.1 conjugal transfer protein TraD [Legionella pneumophila]HAU1911624.1 conjugal transfer protein TraD [Legionella pneumophila]HBD7087405.1 conjugal transfer protein TraD [Legionella pneumophila]HBI5725661.1 conjugal transfer protein TraD [Legionella pneumophila]
MTTFKQIEKAKQLITRCDKSLALEKLKNRKAETRRKIELGGLVIKSGMGHLSKSVILGALAYSLELIISHEDNMVYFKSKGDKLFSSNS